MHDLMDGAADEETVEAIRQTLLTTPGVYALHDLRTRKMGDLIVVDVHLEVDDRINVVAGHDIAVTARQRVMQQHPVLDVMTHVDPVTLNPSQG
ncbi:cation diffusion facilitator family transporter [Paludibacterium denitrificans]|uniref:cation diffusion facilitator family transporter n=1 Tax=Paludibacterium denitrificans TaxID=2675226 RepID=UPI001E42305E|nr:cation transporter dimerization domain-containing protein [Paludibacterium denitrificans]